MKKIESLYSYLYKKTNGIYAVKYKFHKKDGYKNTSLGTRNKRKAEKKKRAFDLNLSKTIENIADNNIDDRLVELAGVLLKKMTSGGMDDRWLVNFARKAHHIQSGRASAVTEYTLYEWIEHYVETQSRDVKPQSLIRLRTYSRLVAGVTHSRKGVKKGQPSNVIVKDKVLYEISQKPLHLLEASDIRTIEEHLSLGNARASTLNQSVAILKRALKRASKDEITHKDLSVNIERFKQTDSYKRGVYTEEEVESLYRTAEGDWLGIILVATHTGLRATNCHELKWEEVDLENRKLTVNPVKRRKGYNKGNLELAITGKLLTYLESRALTAGADRSGYIFSTSKLEEETRSRGFRKLREASGVQYWVEVNGVEQKRDFHSLRHYHNTTMKKYGATPEDCMAQLGHAKPETNLIYTHQDPESRRELVEKAFGA